MMKRCTATTAAGNPCQAWAVRDPTHPDGPPLCSAHRGGKRPVGAPPGNTNAVRHGFYSADPAAVTVDEAIAGLVDKMLRLDELIEDQPLSPLLVELFQIYTQASSRLSRLLRDRRALSGEAADGMAGAIAQALDELSNTLGTEL